MEAIKAQEYQYSKYKYVWGREYRCKDAVLPGFVKRKQEVVTIHCHGSTTCYNRLENKNSLVINMLIKHYWIILVHFILICCISSCWYLFLGQDRRGSRSCPPSLPPPCSSTLAWWCFETRRCRRSWHHSSYSNTLSSPRLREWTE